MPPRDNGGPTVMASKAGIANLTEIPLDDLQGFVVIAIDTEGEPTLLTSAATYRTVVSVLLDMAGHLVVNHQLDDPPNG